MMTTMIILAFCILAEGFFSGSEIAIVNANRLLLADKAQKGHFGARIALNFLEKPQMLLGSTLIGTNLCVVTATMTATLFFLRRNSEIGEFYAVLLTWPLIFLFGEIIPKTVYQANADRIAPVSAVLLRLFTLVLFPLVWSFTRFSTLLIRILRDKGKAEPTITRSDVKALTLHHGKTQDIDQKEKRMIARMIDFSSARVSDAMVPLIDVVALDYNMTAGEAARFSVEHSFSRFPVFKDRVDEIVGIVDTYSLLDLHSPSDSLRGYMKKPLFVPESMSAKALLAELRHRGTSMAIVVDEYGGAVGVITVEDVLEEVLGNIEDEFDQITTIYRKIAPYSYIFQARAEVEFINERFEFKIPAGEYETLGGFLLEQFDRIPKHGDTISVGNLRYTALNPTNRNLTDVRIDVIPALEETEDE